MFIERVRSHTARRSPGGSAIARGGEEPIPTGSADKDLDNFSAGFCLLAGLEKPQPSASRRGDTPPCKTRPPFPTNEFVGEGRLRRQRCAEGLAGPTVSDLLSPHQRRPLEPCHPCSFKVRTESLYLLPRRETRVLMRSRFKDAKELLRREPTRRMVVATQAQPWT